MAYNPHTGEWETMESRRARLLASIEDSASMPLLPGSTATPVVTARASSVPPPRRIRLDGDLPLPPEQQVLLRLQQEQLRQWRPPGRAPKETSAAVERVRLFHLHRAKQHLAEDEKRLREHRPFFLVWVVLVQAIVLIVTMSIYEPAKFAFTQKLESALVSAPDGSLETALRNSSANFYFGPRNQDLVLLGAKYTPCMRTDHQVYSRIVEPSRAAEAAYGCCLRAAGQQCYSSSEDACTGAWIANQTCHDASCCQDPSATDPTSCEFAPEESRELHCSCMVTGRPCCEDLLGKCSIRTAEYCSYVGGVYHADKTLCSQVDCVASFCGLNGFRRRDVPDQWYRWIVALFVHVGILHLLVMVVAQLAVGLDLERVIGWHRILPIYLISGIGGYVISGIFTPYQVETGPSPAVYGLLGALFVELLQTWKRLANRWWELAKLTLILIISLAAGLLPYIDNFAHLGGFVFGFLSGILFIPWESCERWTRATKKILALIALGCIVAIFVVAMPLFLTDQNPNCSWCEYLNCVDFTENMCESTGQRSPF